MYCIHHLERIITPPPPLLLITPITSITPPSLPQKDLLDERLADLCRTRAIETRNVCCALYCFARLAFLPRSALAHLLRLAASALVDGFSSREVFQLSYFLTAFLPTLQAGKLPEVIAASLRTNGGGGGGGNSGGGVDFAALISRLCKGTIGLMAGGTLDVAAAAGLCHCLFVIGVRCMCSGSC